MKLQSGMADLMTRKPVIDQITAVSFPEAIQKGFMKFEKRHKDEVEHVKAEPKAIMYGLRFPERDAKTDADYLRISFKEEDAEFIREQKIKTLTTKEQKRLPREVLDDNWQEDMSIYNHKRKP